MPIHFPTIATDGRIIWACCTSTIGPACSHRMNPDGSTAPRAVVCTATDCNH